MKKRNNRLPFSPDVDKEKKKKQQTVTAQIKHRERKILGFAWRRQQITRCQNPVLYFLLSFAFVLIGLTLLDSDPSYKCKCTTKEQSQDESVSSHKANKLKK